MNNSHTKILRKVLRRSRKKSYRYGLHWWTKKRWIDLQKVIEVIHEIRTGNKLNKQKLNILLRLENQLNDKIKNKVKSLTWKQFKNETTLFK